MPIDFTKIKPIDGAKLMEERGRQVEAKQASQLRMIDHLVKQVEEDAITNDWEREFIRSLDAKNKPGFCYLTAKQDEVLTKLFEKY